MMDKNTPVRPELDTCRSCSPHSFYGEDGGIAVGAEIGWGIDGWGQKADSSILRDSMCVFWCGWSQDSHSIGQDWYQARILTVEHKTVVARMVKI